MGKDEHPFSDRLVRVHDACDMLATHDPRLFNRGTSRRPAHQ